MNPYLFRHLASSIPVPPHLGRWKISRTRRDSADRASRMFMNRCLLGTTYFRISCRTFRVLTGIQLCGPSPGDNGVDQAHEGGILPLKICRLGAMPVTPLSSRAKHREGFLYGLLTPLAVIRSVLMGIHPDKRLGELRQHTLTKGS